MPTLNSTNHTINTNYTDTNFNAWYIDDELLFPLELQREPHTTYTQQYIQQQSQQDLNNSYINNKSSLLSQLQLSNKHHSHKLPQVQCRTPHIMKSQSPVQLDMNIMQPTQLHSMSTPTYPHNNKHTNLHLYTSSSHDEYSDNDNDKSHTCVGRVASYNKQSHSSVFDNIYNDVLDLNKTQTNIDEQTIFTMDL